MRMQLDKQQLLALLALLRHQPLTDWQKLKLDGAQAVIEAELRRISDYEYELSEVRPGPIKAKPKSYAPKKVKKSRRAR